MQHHIFTFRKRKKIVLRNLEVASSISTTFAKLGTVFAPSKIHDHNFKLVEKYFIALYSPSCNTKNVNEARQILFASGGWSNENIPPTAGALKQHICRAALQASLWNKCLDKQRKPVSSVGWGWKKYETGYVPLWSELPEASEACKELVKCNCKKSSRGRCKCGKQGLACA